MDVKVNVKELNSRYQLRLAAGQYWLLDMEQPGVPYKSPLSFNEMGAFIWGMVLEGKNVELIVEELSKEYSVEADEITADVLQFFEQLAAYGVAIKG